MTYIFNAMINIYWCHRVQYLMPQVMMNNLGEQQKPLTTWQREKQRSCHKREYKARAFKNMQIWSRLIHWNSFVKQGRPWIHSYACFSCQSRILLELIINHSVLRKEVNVYDLCFDVPIKVWVSWSSWGNGLPRASKSDLIAKILQPKYYPRQAQEDLRNDPFRSHVINLDKSRIIHITTCDRILVTWIQSQNEIMKKRSQFVIWSDHKMWSLFCDFFLCSLFVTN